MTRLAPCRCRRRATPRDSTRQGTTVHPRRRADRRVYLDLLRQSIELHGLELAGYCLMSNHVHLIAIPGKVSTMGRALKDTHGR
jgi:hypothetical protein